MRDDDDGLVVGELGGKPLDERCGNGVQRARGLVHEQDLGVHGEGARYAEALLLAPGEREAARLELVLHLVPQAYAPERGLHHAVELGLRAPPLAAKAVHDVLVDGERERVGALEDHAHATAEVVGVDVFDVLVAERDLALNAAARDAVVHAVQAAQQRGLAAARGADERRDLVRRHVEGDVLEGVEVAVVQVDVLHSH